MANNNFLLQDANVLRKVKKNVCGKDTEHEKGISLKIAR